MGETADRMSRQDRIREAYGRAVGDHDYSPRSIEDYLSTKDFLPAIRAAVPDVTLEEVCAVRWNVWSRIMDFTGCSKGERCSGRGRNTRLCHASSLCS